MSRALQGILVVSIEQAVAAPLCTARLCEAGARVIKIERAEGDFAREYDDVVEGESAFFVWLNRGKESLTLDFKREADAALLNRILSRADIFVQNLLPGATARAGFGSKMLRRRYPNLITCDISGYGETGPYSDMKAYDMLIQCESGLASITGTSDGPGRVGISIADIACGTTAQAAILQALFERTRTGVGRSIAISLFDTLAEWMTVPLLHFDYGGKVLGRSGLRHPVIAPYGLYTVGDGNGVVLAVQNEREWNRLCTIVLQRPELVSDPRFLSNAKRSKNQKLLDEIISDELLKLTTPTLVERFKIANVAFGSLNSIDQLSRHPQLRRTEARISERSVSLPASAPRWSDAMTPTVLPVVPRIGEHSLAIRREFDSGGAS